MAIPFALSTELLRYRNTISLYPSVGKMGAGENDRRWLSYRFTRLFKSVLLEFLDQISFDIGFKVLNPDSQGTANPDRWELTTL